MLEGIICPICESTLAEGDLKKSLICSVCRTDLRDRKYLDFLEYLMTHGIVENLDFFDTEVYSEDIERLEPSDEDEVDPTEFERKKDNFSLYENEMDRQQPEEEGPRYDDFEGIEEDWEEFNRREFEGF